MREILSLCLHINELSINLRCFTVDWPSKNFKKLQETSRLLRRLSGYIKYCWGDCTKFEEISKLSYFCHYSSLFDSFCELMLHAFLDAHLSAVFSVRRRFFNETPENTVLLQIWEKWIFDLLLKALFACQIMFCNVIAQRIYSTFLIFLIICRIQFLLVFCYIMLFSYFPDLRMFCWVFRLQNNLRMLGNFAG